MVQIRSRSLRLTWETVVACDWKDFQLFNYQNIRAVSVKNDLEACYTVSKPIVTYSMTRLCIWGFLEHPKSLSGLMLWSFTTDDFILNMKHLDLLKFIEQLKVETCGSIEHHSNIFEILLEIISVKKHWFLSITGHFRCENSLICSCFPSSRIYVWETSFRMYRFVIHLPVCYFCSLITFFAVMAYIFLEKSESPQCRRRYCEWEAWVLDQPKWPVTNFAWCCGR